MEDNWSETRISLGMVFVGSGEDLIQFKLDLPSILPDGVKVVYQHKSIVDLYITTQPPNTD